MKGELYTKREREDRVEGVKKERVKSRKRRTAGEGLNRRGGERVKGGEE